MHQALGLSAALALVLASVACGSQPSATARTRSYVTEAALSQVEADLGVGAIVIRPIDTIDDEEDGGPCIVNGVYFNSCLIEPEQPTELHVQTTLCELRTDEPAQARTFVECRPAGADVVRPVEIPHCPGH